MATDIILIGLGPHTRRIYYPLLEKHARQYGIRLRLVVDVADQERRIRRYLAGRSLQPGQLLLVDGERRDDEMLVAVRTTRRGDAIGGAYLSIRRASLALSSQYFGHCSTTRHPRQLVLETPKHPPWLWPEVW